MQQNYRLTIAYDGTRFFGWARQPGKDTIQGKLEAVLGELQGAPVNVIGAGRTDAGVHARAMTANVVLDTALTPEEIRDYMNRYLPDAIAVREVKEAAPRFHARYNALGKTYRYTCHVGAVKPVFDRKYVTLLDYEPDVERMRRAAAYLCRTGGAFCLVHRAERLADVICLLRETGFEAKRLRTVSHSAQKAPSLILIEAYRGAGAGLKIMPPLFICGDDGRESAEIKRIYHREDEHER